MLMFVLTRQNNAVTDENILPTFQLVKNICYCSNEWNQPRRLFNPKKNLFASIFSVNLDININAWCSVHWRHILVSLNWFIYTYVYKKKSLRIQYELLYEHLSLPLPEFAYLWTHHQISCKYFNKLFNF